MGDAAIEEAEEKDGEAVVPKIRSIASCSRWSRRRPSRTTASVVAEFVYPMEEYR